MKNSLYYIPDISFSLQSTGPAILGIVKGLKGGKMVQSGDSSHSTATPKSRFDQLEGMFWKSQQLDLVPGLDHQETLELNIGLVLFSISHMSLHFFWVILSL